MLHDESWTTCYNYLKTPRRFGLFAVYLSAMGLLCRHISYLEFRFRDGEDPVAHASRKGLTASLPFRLDMNVELRLSQQFHNHNDQKDDQQHTDSRPNDHADSHHSIHHERILHNAD